MYASLLSFIPEVGILNQLLVTARQSMNGDALLKAKGDDEIAEFADLLPSIHWNQNDYEVLLMQDSQNQHGLVRSLSDLQ